MSQTLSTADAILKDMYVGPVVEQINQKTFLLDQIERDSEHIDHTGRRAIFPVHTNRNRGRGSRGDGGTLPTAGKQEWQDAIVHIKYHYSGIEITDAAIEATQTNEGAFVNLLNAETQGCANDMRKDLNRQAFGTGDGLLATLTAEAKTTKTLEVDSVQYLFVGDPVDVLVKTTGSATKGTEGAEVVKREGGATKKIEISKEVEEAKTTFGVYLHGAYNNESDGLRNIIAKERKLHEIESKTAGNEFWNGRVQTVEGVAGEPSFEQLADEVGFSGNGEVELFLTSRGVRRRLANSYQSQKRFTDANAVKVHGGYTAIMVNELPVISDDDAPREFAFGLNKGSFRWFEQAPPAWMERGGGSIFVLKDGTTAGTKTAVWQAFFKWYAALGCVAPNRNGVLLKCTDDLPTGEGEV